MDLQWLYVLLHGLPRFDFQLQRHTSVLLQPTWQIYVETLLWWSAAVGVVGAVLLLIVAIVWIVHCCQTHKPAAKRVARVRNLSAVLFILSVFCFLFLGICFAGNESVNRGIGDTSNAIKNVINNMNQAQTKLERFNESCIINTTDTIAQLKNDIGEIGLNGTDAKEINTRLDNLTASASILRSNVFIINNTIAEFNKMRNVQNGLDRVEFERWVSFTSLFVIMVIVIFGAVVGFCRHSKKAAVIFSGVGLVVYIIGVAMLALCVALALGVSDLCYDSQPVINKTMDDAQARSTAYYYFLSCNETDIPDALTKNINALHDTAAMMQTVQSDVAKLITQHTNDSRIANETSKETAILVNTVRSLGALDTSLACGTYHDDYTTITKGMCHSTLGGITLLVFGLALFDLFVFILLILVARAWFLYSRKPLDYVEVDDEDPFMPRSMQPTNTNVNTTDAAHGNNGVDIYGSHMYNPRTRFASTDSDNEANNQPLWSRGAPPPHIRNDNVYDHYS